MLRILSFLLLGSTLSVLSLSAQGIYLTFEVVPSAVTLGSSFTGQIKIAGLATNSSPALGGYDVDLSFDSSRVSYVGVTFGDTTLGNQLDLGGFGALTSATPLPGSINLFELSLDAPAVLEAGQADAFILATLLFDTSSSGLANFQLSVNGLADAFGASLPAQITSDSVQIINPAPGAVPEPSSYAAAALALLSLLVAHRRKRCT
jgi:hypothetical protein